MKKKIISIFFSSLFLFACSGNRNTGRVSLVKSHKILSFAIDENTTTKIFRLFPYTDPEGKAYLTFQNSGKNEIQFFDMNTQELVFKIKPEINGENGIGFLRGYTIKNPDSIFVATSGKNEISLMDYHGNVKDRYRYDKTEDGHLLYYGTISSYRYKPLIFINNKMFILPTGNRWGPTNPVSSVIDLKTKAVHALQGFQYPSFPNTDNRAKISGIENDFSRCFDGRQFAYSFYYSEDIYVTDISHESVRKINVKSKYINQISITDDYGNLTSKDLVEEKVYGNLIYDKYKNVYYRIAYPGAELEKGVNGLDLLEYGHKNFSIIILDEHFNIIGETLFPDYTYNSNLIFIREDGLYISNSHFMNPCYSDDILGFQRFDLIREL